MRRRHQQVEANRFGARTNRPIAIPWINMLSSGQRPCSQSVGSVCVFGGRGGERVSVFWAVRLQTVWGLGGKGLGRGGQFWFYFWNALQWSQGGVQVVWSKACNLAMLRPLGGLLVRGEQLRPKGPLPAPCEPGIARSVHTEQLPSRATRRLSSAGPVAWPGPCCAPPAVPSHQPSTLPLPRHWS